MSKRHHHHFLLVPLVLLAGCVGQQSYRTQLAKYERTINTVPLPASQSGVLVRNDKVDGPKASVEETEPTQPQAATAADVMLPDEQLADAVNLPLLLDLLREHNPHIRAAQQAIRAAQEQYAQADYLEELVSQYHAFTQSLRLTVGKAHHRDHIAAAFPRDSASLLKSRLVDDEVALAKCRQAIVIAATESKMHTAYHNHRYMDHAIAIHKESALLQEQALKVAQAELRVDQTNEQTVLAVQMALSELDERVASLAEQQEALSVRINTLLNRPPDAKLGPLSTVAEEELAISLDELYERVLAERPEIVQQRLRLKKLTTLHALLARVTVPNVSLGASLFDNRPQPTRGSDAPASFATRRDLPVLQSAAFAHRMATLRELETNIAAMEAKLVGMEADSRHAAKDAHVAAQTAKRRIALYRQSLLLQARQARDTASAAYRAGKTDFMAFLAAERQWLTFRLEKQAAVRDLHLALTQLEQLAGAPLPRQPLDLRSPPESTPTRQ